MAFRVIAKTSKPSSSTRTWTQSRPPGRRPCHSSGWYEGRHQSQAITPDASTHSHKANLRTISTPVKQHFQFQLLRRKCGTGTTLLRRATRPLGNRTGRAESFVSELGRSKDAAKRRPSHLHAAYPPYYKRTDSSRPAQIPPFENHVSLRPLRAQRSLRYCRLVGPGYLLGCRRGPRRAAFPRPAVPASRRHRVPPEPQSPEIQQLVYQIKTKQKIPRPPEMWYIPSALFLIQRPDTATRRNPVASVRVSR